MRTSARAAASGGGYGTAKRHEPESNHTRHKHRESTRAMAGHGRVRESDRLAAALTPGVGAAVAVRVCAQSLWRLTREAEEPSASRASARASSDRGAKDDGGAGGRALAGALEGDA